MRTEIDEYRKLEPDYRRALAEFEELKKRYEVLAKAEPEAPATTELYVELQKRAAAIKVQYDRLQALRRDLRAAVADYESTTSAY